MDDTTPDELGEGRDRDANAPEAKQDKVDTEHGHE